MRETLLEESEKEAMELQTTSLFYPEIKVVVGKYTFTKGIELTMQSASDTYYDWASVKLMPAFSDLEINKGEKGEIYLGYDGKLERVFKGYVLKNNQGVLKLKDDMLLLEKLKLSHTFIDASPREIIEYCLAQAGINAYCLFKERYPKKKIVPITLKNGIQILEEVKRLWGIKDLFYFASGIFYFGKQPDQEQVYQFEYGKNIIALVPENSGWVLETVSVPFIRHSDVIYLNHPKVSGEQKVKKMIFSSSMGFMRTKIYF